MEEAAETPEIGESRARRVMTESRGAEGKTAKLAMEHRTLVEVEGVASVMVETVERAEPGAQAQETVAVAEPEMGSEDFRVTMERTRRKVAHQAPSEEAVTTGLMATAGRPCEECLD